MPLFPATSDLTESADLSEPNSALIDFSNPTQGPKDFRLRWMFKNPCCVLQALTPDEVIPLLDAVQGWAARGMWCVGYLAYEAAPAFDPAFEVHPATGPLAWFGVYESALPWPDTANRLNSPVEVQWQSFIDRARFDKEFIEIQESIAAGELYQVNYTAQMIGALRQEWEPHAAEEFFYALQRAQPGGYSAFLNTGGQQILTVSPELFFDWRSQSILTRPMKGTAARGVTPELDDEHRLALLASSKERAENVMIVDLLRNDLSRIAQPFSVKVPKLLETQALPSVWQMTSDVTARTRTGCSLVDVFKALFPCGSVTGAPKVQAMKAIKVHESGERGVYCGALGVVQPGGTATFNVPIRTVTMTQTHQARELKCGIGSGITAGAVADNEWNEWRLKQSFVQRASTSFELLETFGLVDGVIENLEAHLNRLEKAAHHFGFLHDGAIITDAVHALVQTHAVGAWRVRLLLSAHGGVKAQAFAFSPMQPEVLLQLASRPFEEAFSEFVRFKTTHRAHYEAFTPSADGVFDTLLWNERQEITECTRGNIALKLSGRWVTPPLECGLLGGVGRASALASAQVSEAVVTLADLREVTELAFINSLRGWIPAKLVLAPGTKG